MSNFGLGSKLSTSKMLKIILKHWILFNLKFSEANLASIKYELLEIPITSGSFLNYLYNKTRHYIYILPIAGQTAGPTGLKFFVDTWMGGQGCLPRATPGPSASKKFKS